MNLEGVQTKNDNLDRSSWRDGPWNNEPDHVVWEHNGFPCLMHRGWSGAWCGYVAVPPGHPLHGKDYNDLDYESGIGSIAHGGLTYSGPCSGAICHVAKPGEPDDVHWFGFDCAHSFDRTPYRAFDGFSGEGSYRSAPFVQRVVNQMAEALSQQESQCPESS